MLSSTIIQQTLPLQVCLLGIILVLIVRLLITCLHSSSRCRENKVAKTSHGVILRNPSNILGPLPAEPDDPQGSHYERPFSTTTPHVYCNIDRRTESGIEPVKSAEVGAAGCANKSTDAIKPTTGQLPHAYWSKISRTPTSKDLTKKMFTNNLRQMQRCGEEKRDSHLHASCIW